VSPSFGTRRITLLRPDQNGQRVLDTVRSGAPFPYRCFTLLLQRIHAWLRDAVLADATCETFIPAACSLANCGCFLRYLGHSLIFNVANGLAKDRNSEVDL